MEHRGNLRWRNVQAQKGLGNSMREPCELWPRKKGEPGEAVVPGNIERSWRLRKIQFHTGPRKKLWKRSADRLK